MSDEEVGRRHAENPQEQKHPEPHEHQEQQKERRPLKTEDRKGRPGYGVLLSVVFLVPVLKLAWTLGGGGQAGSALLAMEPANWPDVLIGILLNDALLAALTAVVTSRVTYGYFAARGGAQLHAGTPLHRTLATTALVPVTFALLVGAFHGLGWGLVTGLVSYALRLGVVAEYRTGSRTLGGRRASRRPSDWRGHAIEATRWTALLLAVFALPLTALAGALDGRSWSAVLACDVNTGHGSERSRVVELGRKGTGVVGWDIEGSEVVDGVNCGESGDDVVRDPWWRR